MLLSRRDLSRYLTLECLLIRGTAAVMKNPLEERPLRRDVAASYDADDDGPEAHAASTPMLNLPLPELSGSLGRRSPSFSYMAHPPVVPPTRTKPRFGTGRVDAAAGSDRC
jgi:hypothetical protein